MPVRFSMCGFLQFAMSASACADAGEAVPSNQKKADEREEEEWTAASNVWRTRCARVVRFVRESAKNTTQGADQKDRAGHDDSCTRPAGEPHAPPLDRRWTSIARGSGEPRAPARQGRCRRQRPRRVRGRADHPREPAAGAAPGSRRHPCPHRADDQRRTVRSSRSHSGRTPARARRPGCAPHRAARRRHASSGARAARAIGHARGRPRLRSVHRRRRCASSSSSRLMRHRRVGDLVAAAERQPDVADRDARASCRLDDACRRRRSATRRSTRSSARIRRAPCSRHVSAMT